MCVHKVCTPVILHEIRKPVHPIRNPKPRLKMPLRGNERPSEAT